MIAFRAARVAWCSFVTPSHAMRTVRRPKKWHSLLTIVGAALIVGVVPSWAGAQLRGGTIAGTVIGDRDGAPVLSAELRLGADGARTRTNERGVFALNARGTGALQGDTLIIRALGFREQRLVLSAYAGRTDSLTIRLVSLPTLLPALTTTVGQRVIRASDSPRSVTVVTKEQLDAVAAVSANQLLRQLPGMQELPSPPSKTSISIRGFDDSRVLVLVDGEPIAGGLIESRDIGRLSTVAVERIEVTKGPSSVEFGSDALGGVINIVQAAPTSTLTVDGTARQGGLGRRESTVGVSNTVGKLGFRMNGGWRQSDRVTGYNATGSTFNRIYDLRGDARYSLSDNWTLRLDVQGSQERQRFPVDASFNGFIDNRGIQGFAEATGTALGGNVRLRAFQQRFEYQYRQSRELLPIRGSADSLEQQERQGRYLASYTRVLGRHTIDAGVQRSHRTLVAPEKVDGDSAREEITEVFVRNSFTVGPVLLTAGARHTNSTLWGATTNPSLGAAWQVNPQLRLRTNVARGFRAPGFKEIRFTFTNPAGGYTLEGNPTLRPESSVSSSIGATWAPNTVLSFDVEGHTNTVDNLIDWRYLGDNIAGFQIYRNVNVARARMQGVEAGMRIAHGNTDISLGYDFLRARNLNNGLPLTRRATHTARLQAARSWSLLQGLATDMSVRYTGNAPLVGIPAGAPITGPFSTESGVIGTQGALLSVDGQLRLAVSDFTELSAGVNNLLGQRPALWTPAFDRQFYAGLRVRYGVR